MENYSRGLVSISYISSVVRLKAEIFKETKRERRQK